MPFRVGKSESTAPGAAEHQPSVDFQMLAQPFDVRDQVCGVVARKIGVWCACVRRAPSAIALIEEHDAIGGWIEQPAMPLGTSRSGTAVQNEGRLTAWIAASLPVEEIAIADLQHAMRVRRYLRI